MNQLRIPIVILTILFGSGWIYHLHFSDTINSTPSIPEPINEGGPHISSHPLQIDYMRGQEYPGSQLVFEQTLTPGSNYKRFIVSYKSEGLKQYALFTLPNGTPPETGWPAIVFNHGYIAPNVYKTTERYVAYLDAFARNGYIVIKPDYRGHGNSEGQAVGGYGSPAYTIDVLNALASLKQYDPVDTNRIGMWGHSMGGHITIRAMVIDSTIKAGVIWAGVVGSYEDMLNHWRRRNLTQPSPSLSPSRRNSWRNTLVNQYGTPQDNPDFWNSISPTSFLNDISGPIQLHHATGDASVPVILSELLDQKLQAAGKPSELYIYQGDDHNISQNFSTAITRSLAFFDRYVKDT